LTIKYDFTVNQGEDHTIKLVRYNADETEIVDVTGWTARMQARASFAAATTILDLDVAGGEIAVDGPAGTFTITIPASMTTALGPLAAPVTGVYDVELVDDDGKVERAMQGRIEIIPEVTR
jgi:hypothetical protein